MLDYKEQERLTQIAERLAKVLSNNQLITIGKYIIFAREYRDNDNNVLYRTLALTDQFALQFDDNYYWPTSLFAHAITDYALPSQYIDLGDGQCIESVVAVASEQEFNFFSDYLDEIIKRIIIEE